jgi:hypothetical protein
LFSAFATAEAKILYNKSAHFFGANFKNFNASVASIPLTTSATTLNFLGEILMFFQYAFIAIFDG